MQNEVSICGLQVSKRLGNYALLFISVLSFMDILSQYSTGFIFVFQGYISHRLHFMSLTAAMFLHLLLYGACASLIPRKELRGKDRHRLMKSQGGHSVMLAYFCGFGVLAEYVRLARNEGGGLSKIMNAARLHAFGFSIAKILCLCTVLFSFDPSDFAFLAVQGYSPYFYWSFSCPIATFFMAMCTKEVKPSAMEKQK